MSCLRKKVVSRIFRPFQSLTERDFFFAKVMSSANPARKQIDCLQAYLFLDGLIGRMPANSREPVVLKWHCELKLVTNIFFIERIQYYDII